MKNFYISFLKFLVNTTGRLSNGIDMCMTHGLTSGMMLDYIYRNKATGKFFIGKIIDRMFLSHRGWECIRIRKNNLEALLLQAAENVIKRKNNAFVVDVASGPALYIINVLSKFKNQNIKALCRDLDERWLVEGRKNAKAAGITSLEFEKGDALDKKSFNKLKPDIMVSSGFYDWIVDDEMIKKSIEIIFNTTLPGGYFVFTTQTGHVDMKMVSEIFPDFNKQPLRMTVRPAEKVNNWAAEAGFSIIETRHDKWGYYAVTLAEKK